MKRAQALRAEGLTLREIGERMGGAPPSTVHSWLADPDLSKQRARRRERYSGTCEDCGGRTDGSRGYDAPPVCGKCLHRRSHENRHWTPETIVKAMRRWRRLYGKPPQVADWNQAPSMRRRNGDVRRYLEGGWPSSSVVLHECGSWNAALRLAGFKPLREFNRPYEQDPGVLDEMVSLYRDGESTTDLAYAYGISTTRIYQLLDKAGVPRRSMSEAMRLRYQREREAA